MCIALLDNKLANGLNDGNLIQFWLFTMRAVAKDNSALPALKSLFMKYSSCLNAA